MGECRELLSALRQDAGWQEAAEVLSRYRLQGVELDVIHYNLTISACERAREWASALHVLASMAKPTAVSRNTAISACRWMQALQIFASAEQVNKITFNSTMNAMSSWLDALQLLSKARQAAHEDIVAFNQLVSCLGRVAHWRRGLDVLRCGLAQRLEATRVTYNATSSSFEKASRWQRLLFSLEHMAKSTSMANSALTSCEKSHRWQQALEIWGDMKPDVISFNAVISALEKGSQWQRALLFLAAAEDADVITFNATMSACDKGKQWQHAMCLLQLMGLKTLEPDLISYNSAISACRWSHAWRWALWLLKDARLRSLRLDVITYTSAIAACERASQWEYAMLLLQELEQTGMTNRVAVNASISAARSQWTLAHHLLAHVQPDVVSLSSCLSACDVTCWPLQLRLLTGARIWALRPNIMAYTAALPSLPWHHVLQLMKGLRCTEVTYSAAAGALAKHAEWLQAFLLLSTCPGHDVLGAACGVAVHFAWHTALAAAHGSRMNLVSYNELVAAGEMQVGLTPLSPASFEARA